MGSGFQADPAVERWYKMRETTHLYFRPTPRNAIFGLVTLTAIPIGLYLLIDAGNVPQAFMASIVS